MITLTQIRAWCICALSVVLAFYVAVKIADGGLATFSTMLTTGIVVAWIAFGGARWWWPLFFGMGIGGTFYFGFKVYPYEVGFFLALLAVIPLVALRTGQPTGQRVFPRVLVFFLIFIAFHAAMTCVHYGGGSWRSIGSICRVYLREAWAPFFMLLFYFYGESRLIPTGFYVLEFTYFARLVLGVVAFFYPNFTYVPGLNLVLPGSGPDGSVDLRASGLGLATTAMAFSFYKKGWLHSMFQAGLFIAGWAALMMGASRSALIFFFVALVFFSLFSRRSVILWVVGAAFFGFLCLVNLKPEMLDGFDSRIQRTSSILVLYSKGISGTSLAEVKKSLEGDMSTNDFHKRIQRAGFQRWTQNIPQFLFGTGLRPFDESFQKEPDLKVSFELAIAASADTGAYESGLWTVLAGTGLVTLLFYIALFGHQLKRIWNLYPIAEQTPFGRSLVFLTCYLVTTWIVFGYWEGSFPSYELMVVALTAAYLQDRAAEFKTVEDAT